MSLILDALNRAERERKKTQTIPDLQTVHEPAAPVVAGSRNKSFVWLLVIIAVLALAIILYVVTSMSARAPQQAQDQPVLPATALKPETEPVNTVSSMIPIEPPPHQAEIPTPAEAAETTQTPTQSPDLDELYATARAAESEDPVSDLYVEPEREEESVAQRLTVRDYNSLIEVPDIGDLPWSFRNEIPSLNYVRHNFDEGSEISVVINGRAHRAGSTLAPELVLEEIYVDGVLFRFKQIRFKLRALNSWINM